MKDEDTNKDMTSPELTVEEGGKKPGRCEVMRPGHQLPPGALMSSSDVTRGHSADNVVTGTAPPWSPRRDISL